MEEGKDNTAPERGPTERLQFHIDQWPPCFISFAVACQHLVICFSIVVSITVTLSDAACVSMNDSIRATLFCSSLFMVGIATILNTAIGIRLPVFQGPSYPYLFPVMVLRSTGIWTCPTPTVNGTIATLSNSTDVADNVLEVLKYERINEICGSLMVAAIVETMLGATGLIGVLLRFLGPIPISVTITILGFSLYTFPVFLCDVYWPVAVFCLVLMIVLSMYLAPIKVKFPRICQPSSKVQINYPIFEGLSVILTMIVGWILSAVLTASGVFTDDPTVPEFRARTDTRNDMINSSPWFVWPYPGQFGIPKINVALTIGYIAVSLASSIESVGDYFALSRVCEVGPPPPHAVSRGIMTEGVMSMIAGSMGIGHATTSYTPNIVLITLSKVGSRYVLILSGVICMVLGVIGKLGAVMASIPEPVIGGTIWVPLGVMVAIGISGLRKVNLSSTRNLSVIGTSFFTGLVAFEWLNRHPGEINTGSKQVDQVIEVVLGTPFLIGGVVATILDNTVKGNRKDRGFDDPVKTENDIMYDELVPATDNDKMNGTYVNESTKLRAYDLPYVTALQRKCKVFRYIPFLQPYRHNE